MASKKKATKKATKKAPFNPQRGETVVFRTRRGAFDGVVVGRRRLQRGRHAGEIEFTCAPLNNQNEKRFYFRCRLSHLKPCTKRYTKKQVAAASEEQQEIQTQRETVKYERQAKEQNALFELSDLKVGNEVLVDFSDGKAWRVVGDINHRTGKIGLRRYDTDDIIAQNAASEQRHYRDPVAHMFGLKARKRRPMRWLESSLVLQVREAR